MKSGSYLKSSRNRIYTRALHLRSKPYDALDQASKLWREDAKERKARVLMLLLQPLSSVHREAGRMREKMEGKE